MNTPLLFLLLASGPLFGAYYDCVLLLCGLALAVLLAYETVRGGTLVLPSSAAAWCLYGLCACYLLALPFALSVGMALPGFLRVLVWVLFFLYAATYSPAEREMILDAVAWEGALLALLSVAVFVCARASGLEDLNDRIDGPFEYANSWALYQLVCLVLLLFRTKRRKWDWAAITVLLLGVFLTGSRGVWLLGAALGLVLGLRAAIRGKKLLPLLLGLGAVLCAALAALWLSGGTVGERLRAISLSSSSLNGRLLYDLDALRMLLRHPLGLGRGGYYYVQTAEQTGVYTLRHVHNEYLQAALEAGIPAGLLLVGLVLCLLFGKGQAPRERLAVALIAVHALIDFDLQYGALVFLLLLCGTGGRTRKLSLARGRRAIPAAAALLALCFGYFALADGLDLRGRSEAALAMTPGNLEYAEHVLTELDSATEAEPLADRILRYTDCSMLAWDSKYFAAAERRDFPGMVEAKYRYLRLNRYRGEVWTEFSALLERALAEEPEQAPVWRRYAQEAAELLSRLPAETDPLAYRLADAPDLSFLQITETRLNRLQKEG